MECYVDLKVKPMKLHHDAMYAFLCAAGDHQIDAALLAINDISEDALAHYQRLSSHPHIGEYATEFEGVEKQGDFIIMNTVTGSMGLEFAVAFIDFLAPYCDEISGQFMHDEDLDEETQWPIKLTHKDGSVYANGDKINQIDSGLTDPEQDGLEWDEEPKLDKNILQPIHDICGDVEAGCNFMQLTVIYEKLMVPILGVGKAHESALFEDLPEDDWIDGLKDMQKLDVVKNQHAVIQFFINKMYSNLITMSSCEYYGSILSEFNKILTLGFLIVDLHEPDSEESFDDIFGEVNNQDDFDLVYEVVGLEAAFGEE